MKTILAISEINFSLTITFILKGLIIGAISFFSSYKLKRLINKDL